MQFTSLFFLFLFLPLSVAIYLLMPSVKGKNAALLFTSLLFYTIGQPQYLPVLLLTAAVNQFFARRIVPGQKKTLLLPLLFNLLLLVFFKYTNFLLGIFGITAADGSGVLSLALPLGISYFTFQLISYQIDIYRNKIVPAPSYGRLLLFISMFPKMPMGPIVRYADISEQFDSRKTNPQAIFRGLVRFCVGLGKKVLLADYCARLITSLSPVNTGLAAWAVAIVFVFQLYFDFSGYADMAIGLGRVFGFRYPENFDLPFASGSVSELWRRWHMTLGSFFKDYVYIPLGGNRKGLPRQIFNLLVVWLLTGLWHGASWNFVLWGLYFFVLLALEKLLWKYLEKLPRVLRRLMTLFFIVVGFVLLSFDNAADALSLWGTMFAPEAFWSAAVWTKLRSSIPLLLVCLAGCTVLPRMVAMIWSGLFAERQRGKRLAVTPKRAFYAVSLMIFALVLLYFSTVSLVGLGTSPSIYANF